MRIAKVLEPVTLMLVLDSTRKGLVTGSIPTENLPQFCGKPRELQLFKPPVRSDCLGLKEFPRAY